jgi:hypothetical protein
MLMMPIARGDVAVNIESYRSPLPGVSDEAWAKFVYICATAPRRHVSASNAYGMFEMFPRRLADFGLVTNLRRARAASGRVVWEGDFVAPLTAELFLSSLRAQYRAFCLSIVDYAERIARGHIKVSAAAGLTLSGVLALLHRAGPHGVESWTKGKCFETTRSLVERAHGVF